MTDTVTIEHCSFCDKHKDQVTKLIVGHNVAICNECVEFCQDLLVEAKKKIKNKPGAVQNLDPRAIHTHLDQYVVGQDAAKVVLSVAIANHYKRINNPHPDQEIQKANILMIGPTGTGKTLMARTVARYLDVPFVIADATTLTEAGYVGDDVESLVTRLYQAANNDLEATQRVIVFLDEVDKISRKSESSTVSRDVSGEGVQQALLKLVEGTKCRVPTQGNRKTGDTVEIDTTNILFIAGGAFVGLDTVVKNRVRGTSIGFGAKVNSDANTHLDQVTPEDLIKFGMIPEFVGRFPSWVALNELDKEDLIRILLDVKHSYISQYSWLFEQDKVELDFSAEALEMIADRTIANKTGARGLHSELERVLLPHMFYLAQYRKEGINRVFIDVDQVNTPTELKEVNGKAKG